MSKIDGMYRIDIPTKGISEKAPLIESKFNQARNILKDRDSLLTSIVHPLGEIVEVIVDRFNSLPNGINLSGHELPQGYTRGYYTEFLQNTEAGQKILKLWFGNNAKLEDVSKYPHKNKILESILYGFNKLKVVGADNKVQPRKRKSKIGDVSNPVYQIHTHVEVPFILEKFGFIDSDLLSIALGVNHDTTEEGMRAVREEDGVIHAEVIRIKDLVGKFPENNLGRKLAMGIQVLTESEKDEIERSHPNIFSSLLNRDLRKPNGDLVKVSEEYRRIKAETKQRDEDITEHLIEGPLKYGGLALQVREFVKRAVDSGLPGFSKKDAKNLALAVINVEFADRIGDMAGLTRIVGSSKLTPEYQRERIKLYAARMLNMMEKLQDSVRYVGAKRQYESKFELYKRILEVQLAEVNKGFRKLGISEITPDELTNYYWQTAKPIQQHADELMTDFTNKKVDRIISEIVAVK